MYQPTFQPNLSTQSLNHISQPYLSTISLNHISHPSMSHVYLSFFPSFQGETFPAGANGEFSRLLSFGKVAGLNAHETMLLTGGIYR